MTVATIGSLFSGIGGLELGLERALGARVIWQAERDEFCRSVLRINYPEAFQYEDVRDVGADSEVPDLICGGFPCQNISVAGKGEGLAGAQSGLWSEYARIVRELRPRFVVVENVSALLGRGFGVVLGDLAALGYDAWWDCIPAAAVGAPHRRDRLYLVAWRVSDPDGVGLRDEPRRGGGGGRQGPFRDSIGTWARKWASPQAHDAKGARGAMSTKKTGARCLATDVSSWPTPLARDCNGPGRSAKAQGGASVSELVRGRPLPMTCTHGSECKPRLNPHFVLWLMGFPLSWMDGADAKPSRRLGTLSSHMSRKSSVKSSKKSRLG